jgi:uncharacterized UPF0146 family protein
VGEHELSVTARDQAGNELTVTHHFTVRDVTKPTITIASPADGAVFDRGAIVAADFACSDDEGVASCVGSVADGQLLDTSEVGEHDFSVTATDHAGNERTVTRTYAVRDVTKPTVTIVSPAEGAVFDRGAIVAADFACSDDDGVASCVGSVADGQLLDTSSLGSHAFSVTATDHAGNEQTVTRHYTVSDVTNPTITIASPADGAVFDQGEEVEADFTCADDGVVDTCVGSVADGEPLDTAGLGQHQFSVTATDLAGNELTVTRSYEVRDVTAPTVTVTSPSDGATFARHAAVAVDFACADDGDGSGLATCVGTVADGQPLDTATAGTRTFTVTATDAAGNQATVTHTYTVTIPRCAGSEVTVDLEAGDHPTSGRDVILGTPGRDVVSSLGGNDVICGRGGNDALRGGNGVDRLFGGTGADLLDEGRGGGVLDGGAGNDRLLGWAGNDALRGRAGNDVLLGGPGDDSVNGGAGRDACPRGPGHDRRAGCESWASRP